MKTGGNRTMSWMPVAGVILLLSVAYGLFSSNAGLQNTAGTIQKNASSKTYVGTIRTGANLPEKAYCPQGYYLVADEGSYLHDQSTILLLKNPGDEPLSLYAAPGLSGKKVSVTAEYPDKQALCEALICTCDQFLLVHTAAVR